MAVGSSAGVKRVSIQEELVPRKRQDSVQKRRRDRDSSDDAAAVERSRRDDSSERTRRYNRPKPAPVTAQPVGDPVPVTTPAPVQEVPPATNTDLHSLAEQYVDLYAKQTGRTLTTEQKSSLVSDVYSFYSDPSRAGRLKSLVDAGA